MLMALFQNKNFLSSNKATRMCGHAGKNVQLQARPRGLIGVRRKFNLLLHPIVIRRLTLRCISSFFIFLSYSIKLSVLHIVMFLFFTPITKMPFQPFLQIAFYTWLLFLFHCPVLTPLPAPIFFLK